MKIYFWMVTAGVAALLLVGCGGGDDATEGSSAGGGAEPGKTAEDKRDKPDKPEKQELTVTINGYEGPDQAGILIAEQRRYFAEAGIKIFVTHPVTPDAPPEFLTGGTIDIAVLNQPQLVRARAEELPFVAIGSLISHPTAAMIWLGKSKIGGIADLKGKTIAIPGLDFQRDLLESVLARGGLTLDDVKVTSVDYGLVPALVGGRADAIFGGSWNIEGETLKARGLDPVITRVGDLVGIPDYEELVLTTRDELLAENPELFRAFMSALARGTAVALKDPQAAVEAIEKADEANPELKGKGLKASVAATLPLLSRTGRMSFARAEGLIDWMDQEGMIRQPPSASELLTNDYLAPSP